ncbi:MAG: hypothetical protein H6745_33840 [Deltaproteobacteria bacterium]|nr:hypothetical protein [Deltaproteobacteria bacterium]
MRTRSRSLLILAIALAPAACGDDGSGASATDGATSTTTEGSAGTSLATTTGAATATSAGSSGSDGSASGASTSTSDGTATTGDASTSDGTSSGGSTSGGSTGGAGFCGDGFVDEGEACDDGPKNADDAACTSACAVAVCGDGLVHAGVEACDDGDDDDANYCDNACALTGSQFLWQDLIATGGSSKSGRGVAVDGLGDGVVVGYRGPANAEHLWLRKYSPAGAMLWEQEHDATSQGEGVAIGLADGIWAVGRTSTNGDILVLRYNTDGSFVSADAVDIEGSYDRAWAVVTDAEGRAYVAGMGVVDMNTFERLVLRAYDADGDELYTAVAPVPFVTHGIGIDLAANGDLLVAGTWEKNGDQDLWVGRFTSAAAPLWGYNEGDGAAWDTAWDVAVAGDGSVYATGGYSGPKTDIWVRKHSPDGAELWTVTHSSEGINADRGHGIAVDSKGDAVVVGVENGNAWIRKLTSSGVEVWTELVDDDMWASANGVAIDGDDRIWVTGQRLGNQIWVARLMP